MMQDAIQSGGFGASEIHGPKILNRLDHDECSGGVLGQPLDSSFLGRF
jgi:hypothetical protein